MKIIPSRSDAQPQKEPQAVPQTPPLPLTVPHRHALARFDGSESQPTDLPVLLESGAVVAIPQQIFRGRVAIAFGKLKNKLLLVCAWCGKSMGSVESKIEGVSHGMCRECFDRVVSLNFPPKVVPPLK